MALVIVLASLVFLVALGVAFLLNSTTELKSSRTFSEGGRAQMLAQSAASLAMAQITDATKGVDAGGNTLAWACQPGMIRTYDTSGNAAASYKLYSWDVMTAAGSFNASAASQKPPANWYQQKAVFTDLNEPVSSGTSKIYPIIDGNGLTLNISDFSGSQVVTYDDGGQPAIAGFSVSATGTPVNPATGSNPIPMPVKWLYQLRQGQIVAPSGGTGSTATFSGTNAPSDSNPIVGRIAFWTDDESSKININTASDGVYWDTPRVKSPMDDVFKVNQPVNGEYQRYPGHPAMTSLSTVIKYPTGWTPGTTAPTITLGAANAVNFKLTTAQWTDYQWAKNIYNIIPRIGTGGSEGGTVQSAMMLTGAIPPAISFDADRLYASVDELAFKPSLSGGIRTSNNTELANLGLLNKTTLERDKFFLTASSRAPDVNLFNKPRVCIWPLSSTNTSSYRTPFDNLIAFCSTIPKNGFTYYFERSNPNSPTADLGLGRNRKLLTYLRALADQNVPGFGGNFNAKYSTDKDQIITEILDYVRSTNLRDPLLVNKTDETLSTSYTKGAPGSPWRTTPLPGKGTNGMGQVVPILDAATGTRGFGRYVTLQGASVLFVGQVDGDGPLCPMSGSNQPVAPYPTATNTQADPITGYPLPYWSGGTLKVDKVDPGKMRIQAMFLPQFFCPAVGSGWLRRNFKWSVDLSKLKVNGNTLDFPSNLTAGTPKQYTVNQTPKDETGGGDQAGLNLSIECAGANIVSAPMDVAKGSMTFGGEITVKIYAADPVASPPASTTLLQTIVLDFNGPNCTVPALAYDHVANKADNGFPKEPTLPYMNFRSFVTSTGRYNSDNPVVPIGIQGGRFIGAINTSNAGGFIMEGDAIRSVRIVSGDARLVAAQENPPTTLFEANPTTVNILGAHNFLTGYGNSYYGAGLGKLVKDLSYAGSGITAANQNTTVDGPQYIFFNNGYAYGSDGPLNGVEVGSSSAISTGVPGDWDNGPFSVRDGPYINRADEGDIGGGGPAVSDIKEPYFWKLKAQAGGNINTALFSPNRMIPSAVTFGSLSTGVKANKPWQTLLFRPMPGHPGSGSPVNTPVGPPYTIPPDHLLLELFSMPVVEPYAISEPLSTAGRINMNYQMVPFTYVNRDTGIRALLKAEKVIAIDDSQAGKYKDYRYSTPTQYNVRFDVNADETLKGFKQRFDANDIFRSASEICDLPIVPKDDPTTAPNYPGSSLDTFSTMTAYWNAHRLTGDNSKERIYATLYPRLTTKSNTFTVHFRTQALKKTTGTDAKTWDENRDKITGEFRGYQTIERYVDPNNSQIPDYTDASVTTPISIFYKFRIVQAKQFAP